MSLDTPPTPAAFPEIVSEIKEMIAVDQDMRERDLVDAEAWDDTVDVKNATRMKEIVMQIGWPTATKVGAETSHDAWLLVQHADHDVQFQEHCLQLMKQENNHEVRKQDIAFLEDRVRVNKKMSQLYGTQFYQEDGRHIPQPIEDEEHVDERRSEMGMGTLEERIAEMYEKYPF